MKNKPFIGIVPHNLRRVRGLGDILLTKLDGNLVIDQSDKKIKDLTESDHIIVYPTSRMWFIRYGKLKCKVSLMIIEPKAIDGRFYNKIWLLRFKFHTIFIRYTTLANKYNNVIVVPLVDCWIPTLSTQDFFQKEKIISIIASDKNFLTGHRLRHQIIKTLDCRNIDILGRGYAPFKDKKDGLLPYNFSIVIENCQETDYFTEKIVDSFACKTVPIYWGCPNIGDYFNTDGIIIFQTIEELQTILDDLTLESYQQYSVVIEQNRQTALKLANMPQMIANKLIH